MLKNEKLEVKIETSEHTGIKDANRVVLTTLKLLSILIILLALQNVIMLFRSGVITVAHGIYIGDISDIQPSNQNLSRLLIGVICSHAFMKIIVGVLLFTQAKKIVEIRWLKKLNATQSLDSFIFRLGIRLLFIYMFAEYIAKILLLIMVMLLSLWTTLLPEPNFMMTELVIADIVGFVSLLILFLILTKHEKN